MASVIFNALTGLALIAISPQIESIFGPASTAPADTYTIKVGIGGALQESDNLKGDTPGVAIWDARGDPIGVQFGSGDILADGSIYTAQIPANHSLGGGQAQVEYVSVTNGGNDGICISHVAVTDPAGNSQVFLGDVGHACNVQWYPSTTSINSKKVDCIWIGRNASETKFQGMGIHLPSFAFATEDANPGLVSEYHERNDTMCGCGPRWRMYENLKTEDPILRFDPPMSSENYTADGADLNIHSIIGNGGVMTLVDSNTQFDACVHEYGLFHCELERRNLQARKRSAPAEKSQHHKSNSTSHHFRHLVKSFHPEHSASELCKSESSYGPDFVSVPEMKFCDMSMKKLWDVCKEKSSTCCMDMNTHTMRGCSAKVDKNVFAVPHKNYTSVKEWNV